MAIGHPHPRPLSRRERGETRRRLALVILCLLLGAVSPVALALQSDAGQPTRISADRWDHNGAANGKHGTSVYTGHVVITQGSIRITADKATLTLDDGKLAKALIVGDPATFQQARKGEQAIRGRARTIRYDTDKNTVTLTKDARVHQGNELISANYIRYNTQQQKVVAHRAKQKKGRVHVVIPPKNKR